MGRDRRGGRRRANGEGSVYKRNTPAGIRWELQTGNGHGGRISLRFKTEAEAIAELKAIQRRIDVGQPGVPSGESVEKFLTHWIESKQTAPKTLEEYRRQIRLYIVPAIGHIRLRDVSPAHLQRMITGLAKDRPATAQHVLTTCRAAFGAAVRWGRIPANPANAIERPRHAPRTVRPMMPDEAQAVLAAFAEQPLGPFVSFMLNTGARPSEALGLTWSRVDLTRRTVLIDRSLPIGGQDLLPTKTPRSKRTLPLWSSTVAALEKLPRGIGESPVFAGLDGRFLDERNVLKAFQRQLTRAGLPTLTLYALRHGAATLRLQGGDDLKTISEQLGHSTIGTTADRYLHVTEGMLRESADRLEHALSGHW
jgi:integrase